MKKKTNILAKKLEVGQLVVRIPFIQKRAAFIREFKEYDTGAGKVKVNNVFNMRSYDEDIHRKLESWLEDLKRS